MEMVRLADFAYFLFKYLEGIQRDAFITASDFLWSGWYISHMVIAYLVLLIGHETTVKMHMVGQRVPCLADRGRPRMN